jgi:hypothetical protein
MERRSGTRADGELAGIRLTPPPFSRISCPLSVTADPVRPARGVVVTFINGDSQWCPYISQTRQYQNRTFSVELLCSPTKPQATYSDASVIELNTCDYRMTLKSIAGCPLQCVSGGSICSTHGVCGYDTDVGASRCFCYTGYEGSDCSQSVADKGGMSAEGVILIIVCIVLCGVIGLVAFMFLKLRKLQVDPAAYGELQGRCESMNTGAGQCVCVRVCARCMGQQGACVARVVYAPPGRAFLRVFSRLPSLLSPPCPFRSQRARHARVNKTMRRNSGAHHSFPAQRTEGYHAWRARRWKKGGLWSYSAPSLGPRVCLHPTQPNPPQPNPTQPWGGGFCSGGRGRDSLARPRFLCVCVGGRWKRAWGLW